MIYYCLRIIYIFINECFIHSMFVCYRLKTNEPVSTGFSKNDSRPEKV